MSTFIANEQQWKVVFIDKDSEKLTHSGTQHHGTCNYTENVVYIADNLPIERKTSTLTHEVTHAVMESYGFHSFESFDHEQLCEFTAAHNRRIYMIVESAMEAYKSQCAD